VSPSEPDYVRLNRAHWTKVNAEYTDANAESAWNEQEITWGTWNTPETEVGVLPDVRGKDVVELGCGTAYVAAWLKRRGARRVVGVDITPAQLDTARRLDKKQGLGLELVEANAEATGLPDSAFDLAISEYGASIWCDPYRWVPQAARLLRPGGRLVFLCNSTLLMLCVPDVGVATDRLLRPQAGLHRMSWESDPGVEFHLGHGDWLRLLRASGFEVEDLVELYAPEDAHSDYEFVAAQWARQWPVEEVWFARRRR